METAIRQGDQDAVAPVGSPAWPPDRVELELDPVEDPARRVSGPYHRDDDAPGLAGGAADQMVSPFTVTPGRTNGLVHAWHAGRHDAILRIQEGGRGRPCGHMRGWDAEIAWVGRQPFVADGGLGHLRRSAQEDR